MVAALAKYVDHVQPITEGLSENQAKQSAGKMKAAYMVYLQIINWEERATEWSGRPDRMEVEIRLIDVAKNKVLKSLSVKGTSYRFPQVENLLPEPFGDYAANLFGIRVKNK